MVIKERTASQSRIHSSKRADEFKFKILGFKSLLPQGSMEPHCLGCGHNKPYEHGTTMIDLMPRKDLPRMCTRCDCGHKYVQKILTIENKLNSFVKINGASGTGFIDVPDEW